MKKLLKKFLKILARILLTLLALVLLCWLLVQTETVQNLIVGKLTADLSKKLKTEISVKHVSISLFNRLNLEGTLVRDQHKDTLLYAGKLKVRITDWFFWKKNADLKYIGLEDAVIHQQRQDAVWNYQFLVDYFSSTPDTASSKAQQGTVFHLKKIDLKNVDYLKNDEWAGERMQVKVGSMLLDAENIDFNKKIFQLNEIELDQPLFSLQNFKGKRPPAPVPPAHATKKDTGLYFNTAGIDLQLASLKITKGAFTIGKAHPSSDPGLFDAANIVANKIDAHITGFRFTKDTIRAIISLTAHERSGLEVRRFKTHFRLTPHIMEFARLDLHTNRSQLRNYYAMQFTDFGNDMSHYIDRVVMDARFSGAEVSSDDIAFFAPELRAWKKQVAMSGKFLGTVADFSIKDLFLRSGNTSYISGDFAMRGLPNIHTARIQLNNGSLQTNYTEAAPLLPALKNITEPNLAALGTLQYKGSFNGTMSSFITNGTISSNLGGLYTNIALQLPATGEPSYRGSLQTQQFNLGKFLNIPALGTVSFKGKITGNSFSLPKIKTTLNGSFAQLEFNGYNYTNLVFNGTIQKKNFQGEFKADDPNFDFTSSIQVDLNDTVPRINVLGDLAKSDLKNLKLTNQQFKLSGLFDLNFRGRNIDDFLGTAKILNASLTHDTTRLSFDSLSLNASVDTANRRILSIQSNEFELLVRGQYNILDLPNSFQLFLNKYIPAYIKAPAEVPKNQRFLVTLKTREFERYAQILDPKLFGLNNATISGGVNTRDSGIFYMRTDIPFVQYDQYRLENARMQGRGDSISLKLDGEIGKAYIGDSLYFPNTHLSVISQHDHSVVHIATSANTTLNDAQLNADVFTLEDGVRINFQPSSFVVNDKKWNLEKEGELVIRRNFASAKNVRFTQGFQEMNIETEEVEGSNNNDLVIRLKQLNIGDFSPLITRTPRLEGVANGNIHLHDFFNQFSMDADLKAEQFRLNNDSVGIVQLKGNFSKETGKIGFEVVSDNDKYNLAAKGSFNTRDSVAPLQINTNLRGAKISILNEMLSDLFSNINGLATGNLVIKGNPNAPDLQGKVTLRNGGLKVNFTQVYYTIDSAVFSFEDGLIDFGQFTIKDALNNTGKVKGRLYQRAFKNMRYDFDLSTDKLLLLDTKAKDNQQFYGKAIGKATLLLKGPQENMHMSISGEVTDSSAISIPTNMSKETADADFIVFKQYGTEMQQESKANDTKLSIDLDLTANRKALINVILDELTGDVISARGNGRLQINIPAVGNMSMKGRYNIENGRYNFNFQSVIRKPFDLIPGDGNYIEWNGDPYDANLHVDARYVAERVSLNDLIGNQSFNLSSNSGSLRGYRGEVDVVATLRGKLSKPDIGFKIEFPPNSVARNDNDLTLFLNRLESDDNEMLKQVTYLIVFDAFAPYGDARVGNSLASSISASTLNSISQLVTSELNKLLSNFLYKVTGDKSLRLDVGTSTYSTASLIGSQEAGGTRLDRQNVNLKLSQSLLDGKLIITFGGDLDFNLGNSQLAQGNFQWLPDISIQYILTRDRKLRAIVFNKSSLDVGTGPTSGGIGRRNRQGISISYTRDFEQFFGNKPKRQLLPIPPPNAKQ